jgi:hypothetical protein
LNSNRTIRIATTRRLEERRSGIGVDLENRGDKATKSQIDHYNEWLDEDGNPEITEASEETRHWMQHDVGEFVGDQIKEQYGNAVISKSADTLVEGSGEVYEGILGIRSIWNEWSDQHAR